MKTGIAIAFSYFIIACSQLSAFDKTTKNEPEPLLDHSYNDGERDGITAASRFGEGLATIESMTSSCTLSVGQSVTLRYALLVDSKRYPRGITPDLLVGKYLAIQICKGDKLAPQQGPHAPSIQKKVIRLEPKKEDFGKFECRLTTTYTFHEEGAWDIYFGLVDSKKNVFWNVGGDSYTVKRK